MNYHFDPESGNTGRCTADPSNPRSTGCPYGFAPDEHYPDAATASAAWNALQDQGLPSLDRRFAAAEKIRDKFFGEQAKPMTHAEATAHTTSMKEEFELWSKVVDRETHHTLGNYSMTGYKDVNAYLRRGVENGTGKKDAETLKKMFDFHGSLGLEPKEPRQLYRYVNVPDGFTAQGYANLHNVGNTWKDKGVTSTTEDPAMVVGQIHREKGSHSYIGYNFVTKKGVSLQMYDEYPGLVQTYEKERIVSPETEFIVVGVEQQALSVDKSRTGVHEEFGGRTGKVTPKKVHMVQLVDKELLTAEELQALGYDG